MLSVTQIRAVASLLFHARAQDVDEVISEPLHSFSVVLSCLNSMRPVISFRRM